MEKVILIDAIERYRKQHKLSITRFCKTCKITRYMYKKIMTGFNRFNVVNLVKIAKVMHISVNQLINPKYK